MNKEDKHTWADWNQRVSFQSKIPSNVAFVYKTQHIQTTRVWYVYIIITCWLPGCCTVGSAPGVLGNLNICDVRTRFAAVWMMLMLYFTTAGLHYHRVQVLNWLGCSPDTLDLNTHDSLSRHNYSRTILFYIYDRIRNLSSVVRRLRIRRSLVQDQLGPGARPFTRCWRI